MLKIIRTEDGSHSLFDEVLNETYHSTRGARGESIHVFIKEGLKHYCEKSVQKEIKILEVGLGTGLNAFLSALEAEKIDGKLHFTSLEPFPVAPEFFHQFNYATTVTEKELFLTIHECAWEQEIALTPYFSLLKTKATLENNGLQPGFDLIYFDAFAPSKQPEVWTLDNLKKCFDLLKKGGVLTTYCAQGQFKRNLTTAGFSIETLQGAMGKKEMVRATKN